MDWTRLAAETSRFPSHKFTQEVESQHEDEDHVPASPTFDVKAVQAPLMHEPLARQTTGPAAIHWFTGRFKDLKLERQFNAHIHPLWRSTNLAGLAILEAALIFVGVSGALDPVYVSWYGLDVAIGISIVVVAIPQLAMLPLLYQAWTDRPGLSPRATSMVILTACGLCLTVLFPGLDVLALKRGVATVEELLRNTRGRVPIEMGSMWIVITGLQTEYRYKVGMLLLYLIGFRLVFRTAFCSELFTQDFGSTVQIFLSTAYIPTIRARERMNKESYSSHRPSRNELAFDPSSIDSLHEQQPSLIPTRGIRSRTRAGLIKYWRFFQDQTFKDPGKEVAFRIYFSKALVTDTRLMYMFACGSSMASTATLLVTYGTTESVAAPAFGYLAYFIPASCIFGFITTFIPPLGPLYPARQQSMALFLYTVLCVMSIFATNLVISTIVTSEVAFDVYLGFSCFRLSIMMARASAPTFRTRYALVAFLIDALSTLYASMTARKLQHGMVVATLFLTVTLMAGFVISPWGEKAHRRYCRTVVWSGTVGAGKRKMKLESKMDEREKGEGEGEPEREVVLRSLEAGDV